jgi:hypothetical protein
VKPYEIRYTNLARTFLAAGLSIFEEQFRDELAEFIEEGEADDLLFHSMEFDGRLFVGVWRDEGWLLIHSAHEETSDMQSGLHTGNEIIVPVPDSE